MALSCEGKLDFDLLQGNFDLQTIRVLSDSGSDVNVPHEGTPVFVAGKAVPLFNVYDALEMALRDELLSTVSDQEKVNLVCELIMDDFARAVDGARDASDLQNWLTVANLSAACMMEVILPGKLLWRISQRLRSCLGRLRKLTGSEELLFT